jgi:serine/threonine-protein kinase RsbT
MRTEYEARLPLVTSNDIVMLRQEVRRLAIEVKFSLVDQTKIVTAASELARNTIDYGRGGDAVVEVVENIGRRGVKLTFADRGPGIEDVELALKDGYTTGSGLGLGLGGSRRLVNEFTIDSTPGKGTTVTVIKWNR